jgi:hypothetical protein
MEIIEGKLYFIKDEFIEKFNPKYHLMENTKKLGLNDQHIFVLEIKKTKIYYGLYLCHPSMKNT